MANISIEEYGLLSQSMLACQRFVSYSNRLNPQTKHEIQSRVDQAMQALKSVEQRFANNGAVLDGSHYNNDRFSKVKDLINMFGLTKRIG